MKLTPKITLVFVLYATALLVSVALLAYYSGKNSLRSATVSELQSTGIEKSGALNQWVEQRRADIEILASYPATITNAMVMLSASHGSAEAQTAHDRFVKDVQPQVQGGEFPVVMLLDASTGQVMAATDPSEEGKFKEDRLFFINGKVKPYLQNVYYSISSQGPAMTAAAPVLSPDGKLLGVLAGRLNLDEMNAIINRRTDLWHTEEAFLVNASNLFVTQPRLSPNPSVLQHGIHTIAVNRCLTGSIGTVSDLDYRGVPALIVYRWLPERNLCLIVKIDQAEALAPAYNFGHKVAAISALALLVAILLAGVFSRSITRPIKALQSWVVRFGQGEQDIRLPVKAHDELGTLAREFNRMAESLAEKDARLHEYATELERKVEERTAAIKQREERYRSYIEVTGQLGWTTNAEGLVEEDIPSWRGYTGQSEEEVRGWGWSNALHPDDREHATQVWRNAIAARTNYEVEYRVRRFDGVYRHFLARGVPIVMPDGTIQEWVGTCIDITERKQTEEALRRFELLSEHSRDIILFMRLEDGRILEANVAAMQAYGYSRDELLALTIQDLRARDTQDLTSDQMNRANTGGILFETVHMRKDGSTFPVEVSSQGATIGDVRTLVSIVRDITERKQAEEEIASLSKFPTENPNPVLRVQTDGKVIYANAASRELLELWQCEVNEYIPADFKDLINAQVQAEANKTVDIPCNDKVYSIMLAPVLESGYVNLYGRDITARRLAERALLKSEEKYRLLADNSKDWIYWIRPDGSFRYVSPACERISGFTPSDFLTNPHLFIDIVHPEDRERVEAHLNEFPSKSGAENLEYRIITNTGELRWINHSCNPLYTDNGEYIGRSGANRDITERKQAETSLHESEGKLRVAVKNSNFVLAQFDRELRYQWIYNPHPDFDPSQVIGKRDDELDSSEGPSQLAALKQRVIESGEGAREEISFQRSDGARTYDFTIEPILDTGGLVVGATSAAFDITERVQTEEELQRMMEELKHSNAELEQFAYVASHDLQEPLRGIAGLAQLLQHRYQGQLDTRADEYIDHIVDGTQRMQTLINDLLAYSRIGRRGETIQTADANTVLRAALENLSTAIHEYGATVTHESLPLVLADSTQLIQLFQNLIGNAIKFRSESSPQIHIGVSDAGAFWQFSVADNGIGIEPEYFERIFQVFQRLHTRREYKGTGIGLAICKKIIERHGGQIWVESEFGQGSTFYFTLQKGK